MGSERNWMQIFGYNKWLWPFPVFRASGKPLGDGISWPKNTTKGGDDAEKGSLLNKNKPSATNP